MRKPESKCVLVRILLFLLHSEDKTEMAPPRGICDALQAFVCMKGFLRRMSFHFQMHVMLTHVIVNIAPSTERHVACHE